MDTLHITLGRVLVGPHQKLKHSQQVANIQAGRIRKMMFGSWLVEALRGEVNLVSKFLWLAHRLASLTRMLQEHIVSNESPLLPQPQGRMER